MPEQAPQSSTIQETQGGTASNGEPSSADAEIIPDEGETDIGEHLPEDAFLAQADRMKHSPHEHIRSLPQKIRNMIAAGTLSFTVRDWANFHSIERKNADYECRCLYQKGLLDKDRRGSVMTYAFRIIVSEPANTGSRERKDETSQSEGNNEPEANSQRSKANESPPITEDLAIRIRSMTASTSDSIRRSGEMILKLIDRRQYTFLRSEWPGLTGLNADRAGDACDHMLRTQVIRRIETTKKPVKYRINTDRNRRDEPLSQEILDRIEEMKNDPLSKRDKRIGMFLDKMISQGKRRFSTADWEEEYHLSSAMYGHDLRRAVNLGLIRKICFPSGGYQCLYMICGRFEQKVRADDMTPTQKAYLSQIYDAFPQAAFTVEECGKVLNQTSSSASFHLYNFSTRGILITHKHKGKAYTYTFAVTPTDNPECFALTDPAKETQAIAVVTRKTSNAVQFAEAV